LEFIQVDIEPGARIADNDKGFRFNNTASHCPKIFVVVKRRTITERAAVQLPRRSRSDDDDVTTTAIPRQGAGGIGRSNSEAGRRESVPPAKVCGRTSAAAGGVL
jgi:hypothetical protein